MQENTLDDAEMNIFEEIEVESLVRYLRERALGEKNAQEATNWES